MTTEAPSGSADVSATRLDPPTLGKPSPGDGFTEGNKPAALPAGLCTGAGPTDGMPGRDPGGSGEVTVIGGAGARDGSGGVAGVGCGGEAVVAAGAGGVVMATDAAALAAVGSAVAVPVAVRLTDVTAEAVTGTVS